MDRKQNYADTQEPDRGHHRDRRTRIQPFIESIQGLRITRRLGRQSGRTGFSQPRSLSLRAQRAARHGR